jgi:hypothetical protein
MGEAAFGFFAVLGFIAFIIVIGLVVGLAISVVVGRMK